MTVPTKAFQGWLGSVAGSRSHADLCRVAGIKKSTLAQQMVRGRVSIATVAAISRALGIPVLESISEFPKYSDVSAGSLAPTQDELLSQISDAEILQEIINRDQATRGQQPPEPVTLTPIPHRSSVRSWIDAVGPADLRLQLATVAGIAPQNLSTQISANRLAPDLAVRCARIAGVGLGNGLVATGFLSPAEAGWAPDARTAALSGTASSKLVLLGAERLEALSRTFRRIEHDADAVQAVWEHLG